MFQVNNDVIWIHPEHRRTNGTTMHALADIMSFLQKNGRIGVALSYHFETIAAS
jgi:hypothetical protein